MSFFSVRRIRKSYQKQIALHDFSLELEEGGQLAIVGESGSGKSTLLRILAGLEKQDSGEVFLQGQKILNPAEKLVAGYDEIKLIHQDYQLYPNSTVAENIARPLLLFEKNYTKNRVKSLLKQFGLEKLAERLPRQLSGGQQQKVAIAAAMAIEPEVLLLDEPFSSLDTIQTHQLIGELAESFKKGKTTVIFVTHELDDALRLTDNVLILQKGKIIQHGNSQFLCENPKNQYVARLFSPINSIPGKENTYLRPSDVKLRTRGQLLGHVVDSRFLVHFNSLQVRLKESGMIWEVDDPLRKYQVGDRVYLNWDAEKELELSS
ncbi:ABC transporter ATP-binding protein [Algoriphagus kandeliae]|uniref:ABC transporter ATP-binding protein n=1 Tax=Algoriphagus kandeliae TaxID=2562278 RepID=A0A4Y9QPU7_9BACT|nr:ABC transporter ATP-binding protein [Algoriphagus kandeliae]TFV94664.1 ABC transporter ATP-binding protein [Algoriphagus kandeliae]